MTSSSALTIRLRLLAELMEALDYYCGFAEFAQHGREMAGAAEVARQLANEIELEGECRA